MDSRLTTIVPNTILHDENEELCDTLFYQGNASSQTQALKYVGDQKIVATTGELMWCTGRNNLPPLNVIYKLYIGKEIADVNLHPFDHYSSFLNPINLVGAAVTKTSNWYNGFHFSAPTIATPDSVVFHAPVFSNISIGQETDMRSHREKYDTWLAKEDKTDGLILWAVSRGTAATFCAFAKEKYPEVRLVVLEGAIDSVQNVLFNRASNLFQSDAVADRVVPFINSGLAFFRKQGMVQYHEEGPSPLKSVADFPEGVPVVFITSLIDTTVPCRNTENIARALAEKGKNDVYLLKLAHSTHPNYMFDNRDDRDRYETFIHAIYKKYHLKHDPELARQGEHLVTACTLCETGSHNNLDKMRRRCV